MPPIPERAPTDSPADALGAAVETFKNDVLLKPQDADESEGENAEEAREEEEEE